MTKFIRKWLSTERADILVALAIAVVTFVALQFLPRVNGLGPAAPGMEPDLLNVLFAVMVYGSVPFAIASIPGYLFLAKMKKGPPGGGSQDLKYHWQHEDGTHAPIFLDPHGDWSDDFIESFHRGQRKERASLIGTGQRVL